MPRPVRDCDIDVSNTNGGADAFNANHDWHPEMSTNAISDMESPGPSPARRSSPGTAELRSSPCQGGHRALQPRLRLDRSPYLAMGGRRQHGRATARSFLRG